MVLFGPSFNLFPYIRKRHFFNIYFPKYLSKTELGEFIVLSHFIKLSKYLSNIDVDHSI